MSSNYRHLGHLWASGLSRIQGRKQLGHRKWLSVVPVCLSGHVAADSQTKGAFKKLYEINCVLNMCSCSAGMDTVSWWKDRGTETMHCADRLQPVWLKNSLLKRRNKTGKNKICLLQSVSVQSFSYFGGVVESVTAVDEVNNFWVEGWCAGGWRLFQRKRWHNKQQMQDFYV